MQKLYNLIIFQYCMESGRLMLNYCGHVKPYDNTNLGRQRFVSWFIAWRLHAIIWTDVDLILPYPQEPMSYLDMILHILICKTSTPHMIIFDKNWTRHTACSIHPCPTPHLSIRKWKPFHRRHFRIHFHEWKVLHSDSICTGVCSKGSNCL